MATVVASKPSAPHQAKMKRPPLPAVQTSGIQSSQSSPSPLLSSSRPPSGFKAPPTPSNSNSMAGNSTIQSRASQRRKDPQKAIDLQNRNRNGKDGERKVLKRKAEPHVKSPAYILRRYKGQPPSLIINLHPTNFRFEQQDGSFPYDSPMSIVLQHLKSQTVPHDMIEELIGAGVRFYENCLIVQVKDHRHKKAVNADRASDKKSSHIPASLHNYEQWIVPSPYVPFPERKISDASDADSSESHDVNAVGKNACKTVDNEPSMYTVVLFPTPLSMQEEIFIQMNAPDSKSGARKLPGSVLPRTPASIAAGSSSSTLPLAPLLAGSGTKRHRTSISGAEVQAFESKIITATAAPLFLEPAENMAQSDDILESLTDPLHRGSLPAPKTRKRTVAELAADERIAAQEQAFMLIMDESAGSALAKASANTDANANTFQPRFERFNAIQQIKAQLEEARALAIQKQRRDNEAKQLEQAQRHNAEQRRREQIDKENKSRMFQQQQQQQMANLHAQREGATRMARQQQMAQVHAQAQGTAMAQNGFPQAQHSSPIIRNSTPHMNGSPVVGNLNSTQSGANGIPMQSTSSGQGNSPSRPHSSLQHVHPNAGGVGMVHQRSRQQNISRTGTPQMNGPNGTPQMAHTTPHMGIATPTSHMPQHNASNAMNIQNMNAQMLAAQRANGGVPLTPEQYQIWTQHQRNQQHTQFQVQQQQMMAQQQQQARQKHQQSLLQQQQQVLGRQAMQQAQQQQQTQQQRSPNPQVIPDGAPLQSMQQQMVSRQEAVFRQTLQNQQALAAANGVGMPNGGSPHPLQTHATDGSQTVGANRPMPAVNNAVRARQTLVFQEQYSSIVAQYTSQNGGSHAVVTPQISEQARNLAIERTKEIMRREQPELQAKAIQERQRQAQIAHAMRQAQQTGMGQNNAANMQAMGFAAAAAAGGQGTANPGGGLTREQFLQAQMNQMAHMTPGGTGIGQMAHLGGSPMNVHNGNVVGNNTNASAGMNNGMQ